MSDVDWGKLIDAAMQGDEQAWRAIVERLRPMLRQTADRELAPRVRRRVDPSDVVQRSLLEAWQARAKFGGASRAELVAWLSRILERNLKDEVRQHIQTEKRSVDQERSLDELRSSGAGRPDLFAAAGLSPRSELLRRELLARLLDSVADLPQQQREAVRLRYFERCTLVQMAERLKVSENAAAQLLHRAVRKLRQQYREGEAPAEPKRA